MIKEISIKKIATYDSTGVVFSGLKKINFFSTVPMEVGKHHYQML